jgi:hypothetical protein
MLAQERSLLKAQAVFQEMCELVENAGSSELRMDEVERALFDQALRLCHSLLEAHVRKAGNGNEGKTVERDGKRLRQLGKRRRRYVSVFGEISLSRYVYGTRKGQKIEYVPLDAQLGMPASDFSYVLEDWQQKLVVKDPFGEAVESLHDWLGIGLGVRTVEQMNRRMAEHAERFRASQPPPEPDEEGKILIVTADGKGVPMRRPLEERIRELPKRDPRGRKRKPKPAKPRRKRLGKGERRTKKQMAYVGAVYSLDVQRRQPQDILDEIRRRKSRAKRPQPQNKRVHVQMTRILEGEVFKGMPSLFGELAVECHERDAAEKKTLVCLMDGDINLWNMQREWFPRAVGILDLYHVLERLWIAAHVFHPERSVEAEQFVDHYLQMLLGGKVGHLIGGMKRKLGEQRGSKRKALKQVITYLENNRQYMKYDEYLAAGYPIGSGVVEGACRYVVKDRMERTGMRWEIEGAHSMLQLRSIYINSDWHNFVEFRIQREQDALYGIAA